MNACCFLELCYTRTEGRRTPFAGGVDPVDPSKTAVYGIVYNARTSSFFPVAHLSGDVFLSECACECRTTRIRDFFFCVLVRE